MRIVVNELPSLKQRTGIGHYTAELLQGLRACDQDEVVGFPTGMLRGLAGRLIGIERKPGAAPGWSARLRSQVMTRLRPGFQAVFEWQFRRSCAAGHFDLYHEPNFLPMPADCPTVATFHDLSPLRDPTWHPAERVARFERQLATGLSRCAHLVTDTEAVRREVIRDLGISPGRVTCVPIGVRPDFQPLPTSTVAAGLRRLGLPPQYLLAVGTIEPRKNILRLLQAYCQLPGRLRLQWPLVLAGGWGWNSDDVAAYLADEARHRGVVHLGYVPAADLPILYNGARALLFPSHYEGFGLPPLEMMACGGAVIASTADAVREVCGRRAHLVPASDDDGWYRALARIIADDGWCQSLRQGTCEWAAQFTWERCAVATRAVYAMVLGKDQVDAPLAGQRAAG